MSRISVEREYFSLSELAQYSGLSVRTLRSYLRRSVYALPHYLIEGKILVRRSEFDAWISHYQRGSRGQDVDLDNLVHDVLSELR